MFYCRGGAGKQAAIGTAAAMQWQSQVSSLMLTVSHGLIHPSAFRILAYIYKQLTLPVLLQSYVIPLSFSLWDNPLRTYAHALIAQQDTEILPLLWFLMAFAQF